MSTISILQDHGYELREPYSKHLEEGIFEREIEKAKKYRADHLRRRESAE